MQSSNEQIQDNTASAPSVEEYLKGVESDIEKFEREQFAQTSPSESKEHWRDLNPTQFTAEQRAHTTVLHAGLTMAHDLFVQSAFRGLGYKVEAMDVPDTRALQFGREFGNRGQCNPTYFTVGNLVKKLKQMEASGIAKEDIINNYLFATAGSCGPCRFGTYVTEYRKALRDAGFEGFRVILFQQSGGVKQATGESSGLEINAKFFTTFGKAVILGDVINLLAYRIRPYEVNPGETNEVIGRAKQRIAKAFETRKGMLNALWQTRKELKQIKVDRSQVKPKVAIIGEFWAMTTEGDGNYKMQSFLEKEGAEVDIQGVTNWILYLLWAARYDTKERARLKGTDKKLGEDGQGSKFALEGQSVAKKLWGLAAVNVYVRTLFSFYSKVLGLKDYHLPNMDEIAEISHAFYDNNLRGGEGHMEVGKLIQNVMHQKVNMTLSIKPFGCMPSSSVSDGVQSLITEIHPNAIFLPIETNGDGAVNVYSRVQMQLFKAKQAANNQLERFLAKNKLSYETFQQLVKSSDKYSNALHRSAHAGESTCLDLAHEVVESQRTAAEKAQSFVKNLTSNLLFKKRHSHLQAALNSAQRLSSPRTEESIVKIVEP